MYTCCTYGTGIHSVGKVYYNAVMYIVCNLSMGKRNVFVILTKIKTKK